MIVLAVWSPNGLLDRLTAWDGLWYLKIAAHGYDLGAVLDAHGQLNPFTSRAFFPAYPWLTRGLAEELGIGLVPASLCVWATSFDGGAETWNVMCLGSSSLMHAKPRFLLPAFTLLVPIAIGLSNRRPSTAVLTVCGAAVLSAWFGAYALVGWKYAI